MDTNNLAFRLLPAAGSKRASPSHDIGGRDAKIQRRLSYDGNTNGSDLENGPWQQLYQQSNFLQHHVGRDYQNRYGHGPGSESEDFTRSGYADPPFDFVPNTYQEPTNEFPPSLDNIDFPMGDAPAYLNRSPTRTLEETSTWMDFDDANGFLQSASNTYTTTPLAPRYEVNASQHGPPTLDASQINSAVPRAPEMLAPEKSLDISSDYNTCFGVITLVTTSSHIQNREAHSVPVKLVLLGNLIMIRSQGLNSYLGLLINSGLVGILRQASLKLDAKLFISEAKVTKAKRKSHRRKQNSTETSTETIRECNIRVVVYGLRDDADVAGRLLSDAGLFLQQPSATEVIPEVQYHNPHYLVSAEKGMPELEKLQLDDMNDSNPSTEVSEEIVKSPFLRIFETAEADGGGIIAAGTHASPRLRSSLMRHQILALAMMQEKECGFIEEPIFPSLWRREFNQSSSTIHYRHAITLSLEPKPIPAMGGILADDMGLGKTLSILALICSSLDVSITIEGQDRNMKHQGTLIVAPKSTIYGWSTQISEHIHDGQIRAMIYHGSNRESLANQFKDFDIVITTYETLRTQWANREKTAPLVSWKWLRIVLDEAHHIRNHSGQTFQSVCDLTSKYRWCLTGTPIHNSLDDYGALLSFVRVFPFTQRSNFNFWIVKPLEEKHPRSTERLQTLVRATCLRRTKEKTLSLDELRLPPVSEKIENVQLHKDDQDLYDAIKTRCAEVAAGLDEQPESNSSTKNKAKNILSIINALRLICDHGEQLLPSTMKPYGQKKSGPISGRRVGESLATKCSICKGEIYSAISTVDREDPICTSCAASEAGWQIVNTENGPLNKTTPPYRPSAKILALLENLKHDQIVAQCSNQPRKSVVFSFWVKMLDLVAQALQREHIEYQYTNGQTSLDGRQKAMQEFHGNPNCTVLLATIGSSAEGINLTAASTVHLLEPHWNPMVEAQAIDRVHRIGQTQQVTVIRYIVPNSVETYVRYVQNLKRQLIDGTMNIDDSTEVGPESKSWERMREMLAYQVAVHTPQPETAC
ncbi:SNF2 family N-terminal domain-containing protein [Nemania sp. NC0429]|nr:SNF2 family N-terminal domain-containing protein [Nemania sp. NC0429]